MNRTIVPVAPSVRWQDDLYNHRKAVVVWFLLSLLAFVFTVIGLSLGAPELNRFAVDPSSPLGTLQHFGATIVAVAWLAFWRWLWLLKWVNWIFLALVCSDLYHLIMVM